MCFSFTNTRSTSRLWTSSALLTTRTTRSTVLLVACPAPNIACDETRFHNRDNKTAHKLASQESSYLKLAQINLALEFDLRSTHPMYNTSHVFHVQSNFRFFRQLCFASAKLIKRCNLYARTIKRASSHCFRLRPNAVASKSSSFGNLISKARFQSFILSIVFVYPFAHQRETTWQHLPFPSVFSYHLYIASEFLSNISDCNTASSRSTRYVGFRFSDVCIIWYATI